MLPPPHAQLVVKRPQVVGRCEMKGSRLAFTARLAVEAMANKTAHYQAVKTPRKAGQAKCVVLLISIIIMSGAQNTLMINEVTSQEPSFVLIRRRARLFHGMFL